MVLSAAVLSLVFASVCLGAKQPAARLKSAFQAQGCATPDVNNFCPVTAPGSTFRMLCGSYSWGQAQTACYAQPNMRPAQVFDYNALAALTVVQDCLLLGGQRVWIDAFNQLGADPCAYIDREGDAVYSPGDQLCAQLRLPVLCEEIPTRTTEIVVASVVSTITSGVLSVLTTTCIQCNCQGPIPTPTTVTVIPQKAIVPAAAPAPKAVKAEDGQEGGARRPHQCGRDSSSCSHHHGHGPRCFDPQGCLPACPFSVGGLHVIQANLTFNQAERECAKYGWSLADIYAGLHADVGFMQRQCAIPQQDWRMWIRSYNGVDGGVCLVTLFDDFANVPVGFGLSADFCMEQPLYVLCQERPAAITGIGAFYGSVTVSQVVITTPTTVVEPTLTTTVTITNYY